MSVTLLSFHAWRVRAVRACLLPCLLTAAAASAQEPESANVVKPVQAAASAPAASTGRPLWEGAVGAMASVRPAYSGAEHRIFKVTPALYIRYGRFSMTNTNGLVSRTADDVVRGLGLDLWRSEQLRLNAALRFDAGRAENTSGDLAGLGSIRPTMRVRLSGSWRVAAQWRLGASWSVDALGRGGGGIGDITLNWEHRLAPHSVLTLGSSLSAAGDRYMQTYYGISPAQSARSGYAVYTPDSGLRDAAVYANWRHDFGREWTLLAGGSATQLLGPAARSPLTRRGSGWGLNSGLAWRF